MKLCMSINYAGDIKGALEEVPTLEKAGLDAAWVAEAYSFDGVSPMAWLAAKTERIEIGSAILNVFSRSATLLAMTAASIDALSGGRFVLGLGASGPQVVEGFHGVPYEKPVQRIVETIEVCRRVWRREVIDFHGQAIDIPVPAARGTGLAKPLKLINTPVRSTIPVFWAALKGRAVEKTAAVADGWFPFMFVPEYAERVWGDALARGRAARSAELGPLQVVAGGLVAIGDDLDVEKLRDAGRPHAALYIGGMGARGKNFYNDVFAGYGWEAEAKVVQDLYLEGKKDEAAAALPAEFLEKSTLVGPVGYVKERLAAYREAGVTHLNVQAVGPLEAKVRTLETLRSLVDDL